MRYKVDEAQEQGERDLEKDISWPFRKGQRRWHDPDAFGVLLPQECRHFERTPPQQAPDALYMYVAVAYYIVIALPGNSLEK